MPVASMASTKGNRRNPDFSRASTSASERHKRKSNTKRVEVHCYQPEATSLESKGHRNSRDRKPIELSTKVQEQRVQVHYYQPEATSIESKGHKKRRGRRPIELSTKVPEQQERKDSARKSKAKSVSSHQTSSRSEREPKKEARTSTRSQRIKHRRRMEKLQATSDPNAFDKSLLHLQLQQSASNHSTSSSRSTAESLESRSSHRLEFDGAVKSLSLGTPKKKTMQTDAPIQSSTSINGNPSQPHPNTSMSSNVGITDGNIEIAHTKSDTVGWDEECERARSVDDDAGNVQSSCCTTRRKICWGTIICCLIVAAAVAVPCYLLLWDSSNSAFPELSKANRGKVVSTISTDICNESVPKSGDCTSIDSDEEQQGGELCNLIAKSMINTTVYGDIALINAGICKQTLVAPELTVGNIEEAIVAESLVVVEIPGVDVVNILSQALMSTFDDPGESEAYPYAAGLRYNVEANLPNGERLSTVQVNRGLREDAWEPIDIRRFYKVITTETLANGGMGYISFQNVIDDWKEPLNIKTVDAFYNYAMKNSDDADWSILPSSEYSTQYFIAENTEPVIAVVPTRICHALIPGKPESSFCTAADVARGGEVCSLVSWAIYDQNFGVDLVVLKGDSCAGDIEEGDFSESSFENFLPDNRSLASVDLTGSDIVAFVEDSVSSAIDNGVMGDYPYAAGLRFDVDTMSTPKVSNLQVLTSSGNWIQIEDTETYTVATTSDLVNSSTAQDMYTTIKEQIISYAADWGTLHEPSVDKASTQSYA